MYLFSCILLLATFILCTNLFFFFRIVHSSSAKSVYQCNWCAKKFKNDLSFERHQVMCFPFVEFFLFATHKAYKESFKTHFKEEHHCEICNKKFMTENVLNDHMRKTHNQSVNCSLCGKKFSNKSNCQKHIRAIHNGEKEFSCDSCNKLFFCALELKKHVSRKHAYGKQQVCNYSCEICKKSFNQKKILMKHIFIHSRKTYSCEKC